MQILFHEFAWLWKGKMLVSARSWTKTWKGKEIYWRKKQIVNVNTFLSQTTSPVFIYILRESKCQRLMDQKMFIFWSSFKNMLEFLDVVSFLVMFWKKLPFFFLMLRNLFESLYDSLKILFENNFLWYVFLLPHLWNVFGRL